MGIWCCIDEDGQLKCGQLNWYGISIYFMLLVYIYIECYIFYNNPQSTKQPKTTAQVQFKL